MSTADRLKRYIHMIEGKYPQAWSILEEFHRNRGKSELPTWPTWCYCPMAGSFGFINSVVQHSNINANPIEISLEANLIAALAVWRQTQGIYRFDDTLYQELTENVLDIDLPRDVLFRLPEWGIYIETPNLIDYKKECGFIAFLEYDVNEKRPELRIFWDAPESSLHFTPQPIHLNQRTLNDSLQRFKEISIKHLEELSGKKNEKVGELKITHINTIAKALNLVLYLCTTNADLRSQKGHRDFNYPRPKGIPEKPRSWEVGFRIGAAIRSARLDKKIVPDEVISTPGSHASPRPHVRRAHWHHFWRGARNEPENRELLLKWIPPISINIDYGDIIPVYRQVKK